MSQAELSRCAAEFSAKQDYCADQYAEGTEARNECLKEAAAGWNECLARTR